MSLQKICLALAILLFLAAGVGFASVGAGSVTLSTIGFGLAFWALSQWPAKT